MTTSLKDLPKLTINPTFRDFLPPLTPEEDAVLEESLKAAGKVDEPIDVWGDTETILDGHHRYEKGRRLKLPYEIRRIQGIADEASALKWIFDRQQGRRNWTNETRGLLIGALYNATKDSKEKEAAEKAEKEPKAESNGKAATKAEAKAAAPVEEPAPEREAAEEVAKEFDVGVATVRRAGKVDEYLNLIASKGGEELRQAIRGQKISFTSKAIKKLATLSPSKTKTVASKVARAIEAGEKPALGSFLEGYTEPEPAAAQAVGGKRSGKDRTKRAKAGRPTKGPFDKLDKAIEQVARLVDEVAKGLGGKSVHSRGVLSTLNEAKHNVSEWRRANRPQ